MTKWPHCCHRSNGVTTRPAPDVPTWAEINPERTLELPPGILETATRETVLGAAAAPFSAAPTSAPAPSSGVSDTLQPPPPGVPRPGWLRDTPVRAEDIPGPGLVDLEPLEVAPAKPFDAAMAPHAQTASPEPAGPGASHSGGALLGLEVEQPDATPSEADAGHGAVPGPLGGLESMEFVAPARPEASSPAAHAPESVRPAAGDETPAVFVTETMAELYLQQGFRDEALNVYRQLLAQNPNDSTLRSRVEHLEGGAASSVADAAAVGVAVPHADVPVTVRAFFAALATREWNGTAVDLSMPPDAYETESHETADAVDQGPEPTSHQSAPEASAAAGEHGAPDAIAEPSAVESQPATEAASGHPVADSHDATAQVQGAHREEAAPSAPAPTEAEPAIKLDIDPLSHEGPESGPVRVMDEFGYGAIASMVAAGGSEYDVASYDAADMSGSMERIPA